jgi:hypothetical protein
MTVHFWPRHGRDVFSDAEEIARNQIYKVRYAHEGPLLKMRIPDNYHDQLKAFEETEKWAGGAELYVVRQPDTTKTQMYDGQGAVLGGELVLSFHKRPQSDERLASWAKLVQRNPHAAADPAWSCATGVLGPVAPRDPDKFGPAETLMDVAYDFYQRALIDGDDAYGKWIYGAVHGNWQGDKHQPSLVRTWQMCHYQNVFQSWLLYFRSGRPEHWQWASIHTNQHVDVSVINHMAYPPGKHSYSHIGDLGGSVYHCKGFVPWGGNASTSGHWIDLANYFVRYQMTGDRRGLDLADLWMRTVSKMGSTRKIDWPGEVAGFQDPEAMQRVNQWRKDNPKVAEAQQPDWVRVESAKPAPFNPREEFVPLGELVYFYTSTWDPQVLIYLDQYAATLNTPFRLTNSPTLAHFGKHWQDWYYDLTRDPRVVQRVQEYMLEQEQYRRPPRFESFAAFLYHAAGDDRWVRGLIPDLYRATLNIYDNPDDRYHQYCLTEGNPSAMILGRLPMMLHAIDAAGLKFDAQPRDGSPTPSRGGRVDGADKWLLPPRGWSNTGMTVLAWNPQDSRIAVQISGPEGYNNFRGAYKLFYDWPTLNQPVNLAQLREWFELQKKDVISFPAANWLKDPPDIRNFGSGHGQAINPLPYVEEPQHDPARRFYRLEVGGSGIDLPAIVDARTRAPLPQVAVIARNTFANNEVKPAPFMVIGSCDLHMRPLRGDVPVTMTLDAIAGRYAMPTTLVVRDARGQTVVHTSVFIGGQRTRASFTLDPAKHPLPWRFTVASSGDSRFSFEGADELFFACTPEDFDAVLPKLQVHESASPATK